MFCIAVSACTFPTIFQKSTWIDNVKGDVNFTTWEMKGWQFTVGTDTISTWEIVDNTQFVYDSSKDDHGYLALRYRDNTAFSCLLLNRDFVVK